jgi:hypothetical protein
MDMAPNNQPLICTSTTKQNHSEGSEVSCSSVNIQVPVSTCRVDAPNLLSDFDQKHQTSFFKKKIERERESGIKLINETMTGT